MCLVLYIGSDLEGPLLNPQDFTGIDHNDPKWPSSVVAFSVEEIAGDLFAVLKHFDTKFVRYAGSFEGCGCGFNASYVNDWDDPPKEDDHYLAGRESRRLLREYVESYQISQIYVCWSGDEALDAVSSEDITVECLTDLSFRYPERTLLRISHH